MTKRVREPERNPMARLTGAVYLVYFVIAIGTELVSSRGPATLGKVGNLLAYAVYALVTLLFFLLFNPVNRKLSLVAALLSLTGCVVGSLALFGLLHYPVNPLFFFGLYCMLIGYLIVGSTFLPRILGVLMALAGLGWLAVLVPAIAKHVTVGVEVLGIGAEGLLMLWLLVAGVNVQRWQRQTRKAGKEGARERRNEG